MRWAKLHGLSVTPVAGHPHGLVIEFPQWRGRIEWGPSQRPYVAGQELRFRAEGLPAADAQLVCLRQAFARQLEVQVYDQLTDDNKTMVDTTMPDEVRWLVMLPRVSREGPADATWTDDFTVHCANEPLLRQLKAPAVQQAMQQAAKWWPVQVPCVLTHNRGWLTLRMSGQALTLGQLDAACVFFEAWVKALKAAGSSG